jgi:hypothetical protein
MIFKYLSIVLMASMLPFFIYAQKLPNIQQNGLRVPANIRIDGKATEWNNKFQAYNNATDIFYTLANDDTKLYLTIQATEHTVINKILGAGIVLTINTSDEKNIKNGMSLTYPILDIQNRVWVNLIDQPQATVGREAVQADSIMNIRNREFADRSKVIGVTGIKGVDTLVSVYNHDGIKAAGTFNNKLFFTCELAVDLTRLGLSINNPIKFAYNITLPGVDMAAIYAATGQATTLIAGQYIVPNGVLPGFSQEYVDKHIPSFPYKISMQKFNSTTNFWGEYVLVK